MRHNLIHMRTNCINKANNLAFNHNKNRQTRPLRFHINRKAKQGGNQKLDKQTKAKLLALHC